MNETTGKYKTSNTFLYECLEENKKLEGLKWINTKEKTKSN